MIVDFLVVGFFDFGIFGWILNVISCLFFLLLVNSVFSHGTVVLNFGCFRFYCFETGVRPHRHTAGALVLTFGCFVSLVF